MRMFALAFLIGVCVVQTRAALEGWAAAGMLGLGAALVLRIALLRGAARLPFQVRVACAVLTVAIAAAAGVAWSA